MKRTLTTIALLISLNTFAQKFQDAHIYASFPIGIGVEYGYHPDQNGKKWERLGGYVGIAADIMNTSTGSLDLSVYYKATYVLHQYINASAFAGIEDLRKITYGIGFRGVIPSKDNLLFVEPLWTSEGSRINIGYSLKLFVK